MNTRCYRCGWSFTLSREAIEAAAVSSAGEKAHVVHCPRCRQAIRIPMDQITRSLPPDWQPPGEADTQAAPLTAEPAGAPTIAPIPSPIARISSSQPGHAPSGPPSAHWA